MNEPGEFLLISVSSRGFNVVGCRHTDSAPIHQKQNVRPSLPHPRPPASRPPSTAERLGEKRQLSSDVVVFCCGAWGVAGYASCDVVVWGSFWGAVCWVVLGLAVLGRCCFAVCRLAFVVPWVSGLPPFLGFPVAWPLGPAVASLWPAALLEQF